MTPTTDPEANSDLDAISLEIMRNQLESIAEEMGQVLITSAYSPYIKERQVTVGVDATVSLLTERRRFAPGGISEGKNGATGENLLDGDPETRDSEAIACDVEDEKVSEQ
jgi:N-methylhydantoinase B/oxoprolinase/acetone carboxylase alpha subunit